MRPCNMDCLNCIFKDCLYEATTYTEARQRYFKSDKGKLVMQRYERTQKARERHKRYYEAHKEEILRKAREKRIGMDTRSRQDVGQ